MCYSKHCGIEANRLLEKSSSKFSDVVGIGTQEVTE